MSKFRLNKGISLIDTRQIYKCTTDDLFINFFVTLVSNNKYYFFASSNIFLVKFALSVMKKLQLLFTKDGLQYQISKGRNVEEENAWFLSEESPDNWMTTKLDEVLSKDYSEIAVISAINHFTLMPADFSMHEMGYDLVAYNAAIQKDNEELMLSVNKKFDVQFYYTFPIDFYQAIKNKNRSTHFNFSGEKFLSQIQPKNKKEIHINLYHHQCEFFAFDGKKVILYNNLDVSSEVDFLYFVMFTLNKIGFAIPETDFYIYGETSENDTFISELRKFVKNLKIVFDNIPNQNFILN